MNYLEILGRSSWGQRFLLLLISALVVVWPIPDMPAARYLFLFLLLVGGVMVAWRRRAVRHEYGDLPVTHARREHWILLALVAAFTVWVYMQAWFIAPYPELALNELRSQWGLQVASFLTAYVVVMALDNKLKPVLAAVYWGMWFLLAALLVMSLWRWTQDGVLPNRWGGLTGTLRNGLNNMSMTTVTFAMFLMADALARIRTRRWLFQRSWLGWGAVLLLTLFGLYIQNMRTALVIILVMAAAVFTPWVYRAVLGGKRFRLWRIAATVLGLVVVVTVVMGYVQRDPRWKTFGETFPIAWDIQSHDAWLVVCDWEHGADCVPRLPNGKRVDISNYLRVAWLHASLDEIIRHPLGVGYSRSALGHALKLDYPGRDISVTRAENSFWSIGIGAGIPGLLLMMSLLGYAAWVCLERTVKGEWIYFPVALLVAKSVLASFARFTLFNNTMEMLMFVLGAVCAAWLVRQSSRGQDQTVPAASRKAG
ncbi:MAG: O-antigen ligase family protein [Gammaproteobacteria bacterium]|jgi:hypothetical protein